MHCSEQSAANDSDGMEQVRTPSINSIEKKAELALRVNYNLLLGNTDMLRDEGQQSQTAADAQRTVGVFRISKRCVQSGEVKHGKAQKTSTASLHEHICIFPLSNI